MLLANCCTGALRRAKRRKSGKLKALIIREPWIGFILRGEKTWEMRPKPTKERGLIGLIRARSKHVVGVARLVGSLPALNPSKYAETERYHRVPPAEQPQAIASRWVNPWLLADIRRLPRPVPYSHTSQVDWVVLVPEVEHQIVEQLKSS